MPSKKLLLELYRLNGHSEIPRETLLLWREVKDGRKINAQRPGSGNNLFQLQAQGLYSLARLNKLHQSEPDNVIYVLGLYHLYREQGKPQKADDILLNAIPQMSHAEDRKWLEAYHFQLDNTESGYLRAIEIMQEALHIFENKSDASKKNPNKHAELLFRLAVLQYDFAVFLFQNIKTLNAKAIEPIISQFLSALETHQRVSQSQQSLSQLDHANLYFWLASLTLYQRHFCRSTQKKEKLIKQEQDYWQKFLAHSEQVHLNNFHFALLQDPNKKQAPLFSKEYIVSNSSFQVLALARLAHLQNPTDWPFDYFQRGESLLAQTPVSEIQDNYTLYRYYYNLAHFYSLKAQYLARSHDQQPPEIQGCLDFAAQGLLRAHKADPTSLKQELLLPEELVYFQSQRPKQVRMMVGG